MAAVVLSSSHCRAGIRHPVAEGRGHPRPYVSLFESGSSALVKHVSALCYYLFVAS